MNTSRRILLLAAGTSLGSLTACETLGRGGLTCDLAEEDNPPAVYRGGTLEGGIYQSSPWDEDLIYFPGGMQVRLEHGLGSAPRSWTAYLSFEPNGTYGDGSMAPAAGNQVELVEVDDQALTVRNSTCADYYLLVTAQVSTSPTPTADG